MPNNNLNQPPSPKRPKLDDSLKKHPLQPNTDNEDFSFLDDIDVDEIVNCLNENECNDTSNLEQSDKEKSSKQTNHVKHYYQRSKSNEQNSNPMSLVPKGARELSLQLERKMFKYFQEYYNVSSIIHNGKFSTILKCKDSDGKNYAVKMSSNRNNKFIGKAKQKMLSQMQTGIHKDNLFCVYFVAGFSLKKHWCFMMEFYPKTLYEALKVLNMLFHIDKVQYLARQLVAAVALLKYNDIIHADIKPSHILLDSRNENLKLCGFDEAYYKGAYTHTPNKGTVNYRSPETILGCSIDFKIDVWSTAIVLVEMATCTTVFPGHMNNIILYKQMCMLGSIPEKMLIKSKFKSQYFTNNMFMRKVGPKTFCIKHKFYETNKLANMVLEAQRKYSAMDCRSTGEKIIVKKINSFIRLIKQMIVISPEERLSIDVVYSDPFFYDEILYE